MSGKHIPRRTCVGCREVQSKRELVRVVRTPAQHVQVDPTGKQNGRGAYLHNQRLCWEKALNGRLSRALKVDAIGDEDLVALYTYMTSLPNEADEIVT